MNFFVDNIESVFSFANDDQIIDGMTWYNDAHNLALEIAHGDAWRGAGVIAAFSPLTPWWRNVELAVTSFRTGIARTDTLGNSSRAAQRIIDGEHPLDVLNGDKTRAFTENIALNGFSDNATIDVHAFSIANGVAIPSSQIKMGKRLYAEIAEAYGVVADSHNLMVTQMQAIVWVVWRDLHNKSKGKAAA